MPEYRYPQLDIRTLDPHLSTHFHLAHMVEGTFNFMGMDHEMRINRLAAVIEVYQMVRRLGDLEHTGDWDWRIEIMYAPEGEMGKTAGTYDGPSADDLGVMCDTIKLDPNIKKPERFTNPEIVKDLLVEEIDMDAGQVDEGYSWVRVPIDHIRTITISYD